MTNQLRNENQLRPYLTEIQNRWISIRQHELQPFQFKLSQGLVLVAVCAVVFTCLRGCADAVRQETALALRIEQVGGYVTWGPPHGHVQNRPPRIMAIDLRGRPVDASLLKEIGKLRYLSELYLSKTGMLDADLVYLEGLSKLRHLHLAENPITDKGVRQVANLPSLEAINLRRCAITDAATKDLASIKSLYRIDVGDTIVTDQGVKSLSSLPNLRVLGLSGTKVTDDALPHFHRHVGMDLLLLERTAVTENGVAELNRRLPKKPATRHSH